MPSWSHGVDNASALDLNPLPWECNSALLNFVRVLYFSITVLW